MGFGRSLRKRISKVRHAVTQPVRSALKPIVGKRIAGVLADPGAKIIEKAHPLTTSYGKFLGTVYGVGFGGILGARTIANRPDLGGKTGSKLGQVAIQIEKPLAGVAGGLVAGGLGSEIAGAGVDAIAGDTGGGVASGRDFNAFGDDSSPIGGGPVAAAGRTALSSGTLLVFVTIGGTVLVVLVFALKKRRR